MSNVVNLDQYRDLRKQLSEDEEFRNWVKALLNELENPQPSLDFSSCLYTVTPYTVTSITFNGVNITRD